MTPPPIDAGIVGVTVGPLACALDARWIMAYAAAIGETDSRYYDTTARGGPLAHPLFPVCYEWPVAVALRVKTIEAALATLGVHALHDLTIHRPPRAGDSLRTSGRVTAVQRRKRGVLVVSRYTTVDQSGVPVSTTDYGSVYRGVGLRGDDAGTVREATDGRLDGIRWTDDIDIAPHAAHVYTEGARIYNPIHTDIAVARAAGLPGLILHGTATLALAVSRVVAHDLGGDPTSVRGVAGRFTGMVTLPSRLTVRGRDGRADGLAFEAVDPAGRLLLADGRVTR
ncbi:MAG TPA: MaoC family dehydratase N-terminal domain-containing protein [Methylomirabilota bacterium]